MFEADTWPSLGSGAGLRPPHYPRVLSGPTRIDWFEVISENFLESFGRPRDVLRRVRKDYPVALHGVSLSIGSTDPVSKDYLSKLKVLISEIEPALVTDHLCWTGIGGINLHDLLPIPYTAEALKHVVDRVHYVQDQLGRVIALENPSTYVQFRSSQISEWEFLKEVCRATGCGILLDVNNVYVSAFNHGFDPKEYLDGLPVGFVAQIHIAGHKDMGDYYFDTHDSPVIEPVWDLYSYALKRFGKVSTLIEWDAHIPDFSILEDHADRARQMMNGLRRVSPTNREVHHEPSARA